jgi:WD40 repeat protein
MLEKPSERVGAVQRFFFAPEANRLFAIARPGGLLLSWDLRTGRCREHRPPGRHYNYDCVAIGPGGSFAAWYDDNGKGELWVGPVDGKKPTRVTKVSTDEWRRIWKFFPAPDGRSLLGVQNTNPGTALRRFPVAAGRLPRKPCPKFADSVAGACRLPDGVLFAVGRPGARLVAVRDDGTRRESVRTVRGVWRMEASPDGSTVLTGGEHNAGLWDGATLKYRGPLRHPDAVIGVGFSPDGRTVATVGFEGVVRFWDVSTRTCRAAFDCGLGHGEAVAFAPDGLTCAVADCSGQVVLWDVDG